MESTPKSPNDVPVLENWMSFLRWLFQTTEKFPKKHRFTFTTRIQNFALDILELLTEARYARRSEKEGILRRTNLKLEKLRLFLRLSHEEGMLPHAAYEHCARELTEIGRQIGGWKKKVERNHETSEPPLSRDSRFPEPADGGSKGEQGEEA